MEKQKETSFVRRHVSQIKVLARLLEHEMDAAQGGKDLVIDRELAENILDTLEIFVEDIDGGSPREGREGREKQTEKAPVTRLN